MKAILITSSILILAMAAFRRVLRGRFRPQVQYALWLVLAVRLLVPLEMAPSAFSALALLDRAEEPARVAQAIGQTTVPFPAMSYEDAFDQALSEIQQSTTVTTSFTDLDQVERRARELQAKQPTLAQLAAKYARPVWLGGTALMAAWFLLVNFQLRRKLRRALPVEVADCSLPVYVTPELSSPCLCGVFRPAVYVTPAALTDLDRLRHVLAHELTHYRHRDHWWALARCACLCVYWFDPLVWWAAAMSRQDCELACDAGAIRRLGEEERLSYGRTLVGMIAEGRTPLLQTATTMTGSKRRVKERVELIARRPKTAIALTLAAALLMGLVVGCTFTGAPKESADLSADGEPVQDPVPLSSDALNTATLPARLLDVPEELRDHVEAQADNGTLAVYYFKKPGEELDWAQYLLIVSQRSEEDLQRLYDESHYPVGGSRWFAKGNDRYYVFQWNTSIEYDLEDEELFNAASRAVWEFAEKTVLETEGVEPFQLEEIPAQAIKAITDQLLAAPAIELSLAPAESSRVYAYSFGANDYFLVNYLGKLFDEFYWEDAPYSTSDGATSLRISASDGSASLSLWDGSYLMTDGDGNCWKGTYKADDYLASADTTPYAYLRRLVFDGAELDLLRSTTVPDRGQSHEEIAREWAENWEGAMTKTAPGSQYARTYVRIENINVNQPTFVDRPDMTAQEALEEFVENRNFAFSAEDFGKIWFGFSYDTVFVPVDQGEDGPLWAGNTRYYEGDDAPEGALVYSHVGCLFLTDEGWTCTGVGTGW